MAIEIDPIPSPRIITVLSPATSITVQDLVDQVRDWEDEVVNMTYPYIIAAAGKEDLGGGVFVGVTVTLQNAKLKFEARPGPTTVQCSVTGGNLVAVDSDGNSIPVIEPSAYTQVVVTSSSSATIAELEIENLKYMIESLRPDHAGVGELIYWDPVNGDDGFVGDSKDRAVQSFSRANDLVTSGNSDVIICLAENGAIECTEAITVNKANTILRGPGPHFTLKPSSSGAPSISVTGNNVSVSGMTVQGATTGSDNCIEVTGQQYNLQNIWITGARNHGVYVNSASDGSFRNVSIYDPVGDGVYITGSTISTYMYDVSVSAASTGINLAGVCIDTRMTGEESFIANNTTGLSIGFSCAGTLVGQNVTIDSNTTDITDNGTATIYGANVLRDRILREPLADHSSVSGSLAEAVDRTDKNASLVPAAI